MKKIPLMHYLIWALYKIDLKQPLKVNMIRNHEYNVGYSWKWTLKPRKLTMFIFFIIVEPFKLLVTLFNQLKTDFISIYEVQSWSSYSIITKDENEKPNKMDIYKKF